MEYLRRLTPKNTPPKPPSREFANRTSLDYQTEQQRQRMSDFRLYNSSHKVSPLALRLIATKTLTDESNDGKEEDIKAK